MSDVHKTWLSALICFLVVLGSGIWIYRGELQNVYHHWAQAGRTLPQATSDKGVRRSKSYEARLSDARQLILEEQYSLATLELGEALRHKPDDRLPYQLLGEIYVRTHNDTKLEHLMQQFAHKFPKDPMPRILAIRQLIEDREWQKALEQLRAEERPAPELQLYLAILSGLQNDHKTAQQMLEQLAQLPVRDHLEFVPEGTPSVDPVLGQKITSLLSAYQQFGAVSEGRPPHLFALIAKALAEHAESTLAIAFADQAITEEIAYIDAWIVRGYAQLQLQQNDMALKDLRHAYQLDPIKPETHYFLGLALYRSGEMAEAAQFFEKSLEHNFPFAEDVRWKLIEIFTSQTRYDKVLALYPQVLTPESRPDQYVSALHLALDVAQKPAVGLALATDLVKEKPEDTFALNMLGWALIANDDLIQAADVLEKAEKLDPLDPRTFLNFGLLYEKEEAWLRAKEAYKKSYELGKGGPATSVINLAAEKYNTLLEREE